MAATNQALAWLGEALGWLAAGLVEQRIDEAQGDAVGARGGLLRLRDDDLGAVLDEVRVARAVGARLEACAVVEHDLRLRENNLALRRLPARRQPVRHAVVQAGADLALRLPEAGLAVVVPEEEVTRRPGLGRADALERDRPARVLQPGRRAVLGGAAVGLELRVVGAEPAAPARRIAGAARAEVALRGAEDGEETVGLGEGKDVPLLSDAARVRGVVQALRRRDGGRAVLFGRQQLPCHLRRVEGAEDRVL
jgi:hypothetical protein